MNPVHTFQPYFPKIHSHTHIHSFILWIHKFVVATVGCGVNHKDTKHTDECSNNRTTQTTQKQYDEITDKYVFKIL